MNAEDALVRIAAATAPLTGAAFFRTLVRHLSEALDFREVFVTECVGADAARVRMLSHWLAGTYGEEVEYELAGTPCERTVRERRTTFIGESLDVLYPAWPGDKAYLGLPVFDAAGERVVGHIAFYDDRPREGIAEHPVLRILASRAGAELLRKRTEDALRDSEARYRLLAEHQSDLLLRLDEAGACLWANPSFCRTFGCSEDAVLGGPVECFIDARDRDAFAAARSAAPTGTRRAQVEVRMLTADGPRWLAWMLTGVPADDAGPAAIIAAGRDVSDRRAAEERARAHLDTLAHLARLAAGSDMATALAHEVSQPLTAVSTYAQAGILLLRSGEAGRDEAVEWLERVSDQAQRAAAIVRRLRAFVRKEAARPAPLHLAGVVSDAIALMQPRAAAANVTLSAEVAPGLPTIAADAVQIQQVVVNLVRNAIEAIEAADSERREVHVSCGHGPAGWVELRVEDTGPGFDGATLARVFEPFFTTKPDGMGIGLAVSREIVEAHGGSLAAQRRPGGGARFCAALPGAV